MDYLTIESDKRSGKTFNSEWRSFGLDEHSLSSVIASPLLQFQSLLSIVENDSDSVTREEILEMIHYMYPKVKYINQMIGKYQYLGRLQKIASAPDSLDSLRKNGVLASLDIVREIFSTQGEIWGRLPDVSITIDETIRLVVREDCFSKIIEELASNAFHYSELGTPITVTGKVESALYHLTVSDKGRGLRNDEFEGLGTPFVHLDHYKRPVGLGLGLATVKKILDIFGGFIAIESSEREGMTVTLQIPIESLETTSTQERFDSAHREPLRTENLQVPTESIKPLDKILIEDQLDYSEHKKSRSGKSILVIEDEVNLRELMIKYFLEKEGYFVITAENVEIGIEKAMRYPPDLIICNTIPKRRGVEVITALKECPTTAKIPLIAMTTMGQAMGGAKEAGEYMRLGVKECLGKPFVSVELIDIVARQFE